MPQKLSTVDEHGRPELWEGMVPQKLPDISRSCSLALREDAVA